MIARHPDKYTVYALTANSNVEIMEAQCVNWQPAIAVMCDAESAAQLRRRIEQHGLPTQVLAGVDALQTVASEATVDCVVAAIVGAAGLLPTLAAAQAGKRVLLANKEALVMSGQLFMDTVADNHAQL